MYLRNKFALEVDFMYFPLNSLILFLFTVVKNADYSIAINFSTAHKGVLVKHRKAASNNLFGASLRMYRANNMQVTYASVLESFQLRQ